MIIIVKKLSVLIFVFILFVSVLAFNVRVLAKQDTNRAWKQLSDSIYIDENSIVKTKHTVSAWFKIFASQDNKLYSDDGTPIYFELVKYEIDCADESISINQSQSYNYKNIMKYKYVNPMGYACNMPCLVNDNIYYQALCKYKTDKE